MNEGLELEPFEKVPSPNAPIERLLGILDLPHDMTWYNRFEVKNRRVMDIEDRLTARLIMDLFPFSIGGNQNPLRWRR